MKSFYRIVLILLLQPLIASAESPSPRFKLGITAPLSGPLAEYGVAVKNGFEMARIENTTLSMTYDYLFEDDQYDPKQSISAFFKLSQVVKADLIYQWGASPNHAVVPLAESNHFPLVALTVDSELFRNKQWITPYSSFSKQFAEKLLEYLRSKGVKRIGVVRTELAYFNSMLDALKQLLQPDESLVEVVAFQPADTDMKAAVLT